MAWTKVTQEVDINASDCNNAVVDLVIERDENNNPLDKLIIISETGSYRRELLYPNDFLSTNEFQNDNKIVYELEFDQPRTSNSSFRFEVKASLTTFFLTGNNLFISPAWKLSNVSVSLSPNGIGTATAQILKLNDRQLTNQELQNIGFLSSLDDTNYTATTTITGLNPDDYIFYIKDSYGCLKQSNFTVNQSPTGGDFIFTSLLNSVRFAKRNNLRRNSENQLSYEDQTDTNYQNWFNKYPVNQSLRFQFQSSHTTNKAFLIENDTLTEISVNNITNYANQKDIRDSVFSYVNGKATIYYPIDGNIYNESGDIIGQNTLEGGVLSTNTIGSFVQLAFYGSLRIINTEQQIINGQNYTVLVLDQVLSGTQTPITLKATSSLSVDAAFDYFEFENIFNTEGCYQIAICASNNFDEQNPLDSAKYLSERILITNDLDKYHLIKWSNDENNQFAWSTGIQSEIYIPYVMPATFEPEDENDVYMTDTSQRLLESESYENYNFHFDLLPLAIVRQLQLAFSSSNLIIDDINYVKKETPEIEMLAGSNLYQMTPKLSKSTNYNSNSDITSDIQGGSGITIDSNGILKLN